MPDVFTNARPYYDVTFPSSGDSFSISNFKNAFQGLGFMDMIPLQPRAHSPGDMRIMVRGRDSGDFFNPYYGRTDADAHLFFTSGDSLSMTAPSSNPRIDIVYLTPSGDIRNATGTEAATPTLPALAPSGDTRIPICAIYHKTTATKIVNYEDKDSNSGDSYIYQDLRPFIRPLGVGGVLLTSTVPQGVGATNAVGTATDAARADHVHAGLASATPASTTGDNAVGTGTTMSRADHTHQGVHAVRVVGSGDMFGDVELAGKGIALDQNGRRITIIGTETVVGSYTGNGVDGRQLIVGFRDESLNVRRFQTKQFDINNGMCWRTSAHIGDNTSRFDSATDLPDAIQSFPAPNRVELGANAFVNTNGTTYRYEAVGG